MSSIRIESNLLTLTYFCDRLSLNPARLMKSWSSQVYRTRMSKNLNNFLFLSKVTWELLLFYFAPVVSQGKLARDQLTIAVCQMEETGGCLSCLPVQSCCSSTIGRKILAICPCVNRRTLKLSVSLSFRNIGTILEFTSTYLLASSLMILSSNKHNNENVN